MRSDPHSNYAPGNSNGNREGPDPQRSGSASSHPISASDRMTEGKSTRGEKEVQGRTAQSTLSTVAARHIVINQAVAYLSSET